MGKLKSLNPEQLYHWCDPKQFSFETTADLEELKEIPGQSRAMAAIQFGVGIEREGYHLFAMGPGGLGKHSILNRFLEGQAATEPVPSDWCYVHNFQNTYQPRFLRLPPGQARRLSQSMRQLVEELGSAVPAAFESDDYNAQREKIEEELTERQEEAFDELRNRIKDHDIALVRTPGGLAFAPTRQGKVMDPESYRKLPEEKRRQIESAIADFQQDLEKILHQIPRWRREIQQKLRELNRNVARGAVNSQIDDLKKEFESLPAVQSYLSEVEKDLIENADSFRHAKENSQPNVLGIPLPQTDAESPLRHYRVNLLIDHQDDQGAPVIYEDHPTYANLMGRIEHLSQMGALVTDFMMIKPGALHKANGGYLILDALKLLQQPYAWEGLKRTLRTHQIRMESIGQMSGWISTVSLEPEPIPLNVKVVLVGERRLYYLLHHFDPDFAEFFKVAMDFEETMPRRDDSQMLFARMLATVVRQGGLLPLDRSGVARVIEEGSRMAGDSEKLSLQLRDCSDLLREADYWAKDAKHTSVQAGDIDRAIESREHRVNRLRERIQEEIRRGTLLIDTDGGKVGQVNGLAVTQLGGYSFGHPNRITARVRLGSGELVDIEREVELGGPIHSKGVLILSGFLSGRFVPDRPLSLAASLVFEQSYGGVEGDSASSAELYALLSALAELPINQSMAVTGSVNQHGEIQAIGGVNEKIEGFFELCRARGLTGQQGVLIPAANVKHLMLRRDVIDAVTKSQFHIYPVETIDQGIALLTGVPAGERNRVKRFPKGTVNARVELKLTAFANMAQEWHDKKPSKKRKRT